MQLISLRLLWLCVVFVFTVGVAVAADGLDNTLLPDGQEFKMWEVPMNYTATFHVAREMAGASDENPGSAEKPWKTISKAAAMLRPGERVVVHKGVYREAVRPERGGESAEKMIAYEAAAGEEVVIKGSDEWKPEWEPSTEFAINSIANGKPPPPPAMPPIFVARLTGSMFAGANTFNWRYKPNPRNEETLVLGQIFLDGKPLRQVTKHAQLKDTPGAFFVEDDGMSVHLRMPNNEPPAGKIFEVVTRPEIFAPTRQRLNFIRVSGFKMLQASPSFSPPLRGALSTSGGHHWIIEDNEVAFVTSRAIYFGMRWFEYALNDRMGYAIVRRNHVHDVGLTGIAAVHFRANEGVLVEDNLVTDIGNYGIVPAGSNIEEGGGIKLHYTVNSLVRRNVVMRTRGGPGIWLDWTICNSRVTQNLVADITGTRFGAVFIEISPMPNLVDNNLIVDADLYGVYEHDTARLLVLANTIVNGKGPAVQMLLPGRGRTLPPPGKKEYHPEGECRVFGNVLAGYSQYMLLPTGTDKSDWNVLGGAVEKVPFRFGEAGKEKDMDAAAWKGMGNDRNSVDLPLEVKFDAGRLELSVRGSGAMPVFPPLKPLLEEVPGVADLLPGYFPFPVDSKIGDEVAPASRLLRADFFGKARDGKELAPGAFLALPLDGTAVKVDPRRGR